ncbi:hypothetical protein [Neisseria sp. 83E34]|uniref:hypothetical protein n=1 Tax=Neisseria sp. 83E34 TaxID=1692264 RepID=UPI0006CE9B56|nr:hypothetical protein [Neisseria sp. 83E34]KPN71285.1 hypothetical protein AKG09_07415 [Neisseria sp. 83E34]
MTNKTNALPPLPAKRYFTLLEVCELVQISPAQFAEWQNANGVVIGYGGEFYTRQDVVKLRQLQGTFAPFIDEFNHNALDAEGKPAADAQEVREALELMLGNVEKALAKQ